MGEHDVKSDGILPGPFACDHAQSACGMLSTTALLIGWILYVAQAPHLHPTLHSVPILDPRSYWLPTRRSIPLTGNTSSSLGGLWTARRPIRGLSP
jgi:hypothetical protein